VLVGRAVGVRGDGVQVGMESVVGVAMGGSDAGPVAVALGRTGWDLVGSIGVVQAVSSARSSSPPMRFRTQYLG
jgi:hypothetical protein